MGGAPVAVRGTVHLADRWQPDDHAQRGAGAHQRDRAQTRRPRPGCSGRDPPSAWARPLRYLSAQTRACGLCVANRQISLARSRDGGSFSCFERENRGQTAVLEAIVAQNQFVRQKRSARIYHTFFWHTRTVLTSMPQGVERRSSTYKRRYCDYAEKQSSHTSLSA